MAALPELHSRSIWRNPNAALISADEQLSQLVNAWVQNDPAISAVSNEVANGTDLLPPLASLVAQYAAASLPKSVVAWHKLAKELYPEGLKVTPLPANIVATLKSPLTLAERQELDDTDAAILFFGDGAVGFPRSVKRVCDVFHLIPVQGSMSELDERLDNYNARHLLPHDRNFFRILDVAPHIRQHLWDTSEQPGWALVSDITPNSEHSETEDVREDFNDIDCDFLSSLPLACHFAFIRAMAQETRFPIAPGDHYWRHVATRVAIPVPGTDPEPHIHLQFGTDGLNIRTIDSDWSDFGEGSCAVRRWNNPA